VSYILAIETAVPEYCHKQEDIITFFQNATDDIAIKRKIKVVATKAAIKKRYSVVSDFSLEPSAFTFFPKIKSLTPEPNLSSRMALFKKEAVNLSLSAIHKIKKIENLKHSITHLITVTCTGLFAPGLDIELIRILNLKPSTHRTSVNFMGCNAALIALKQAEAFCKSKEEVTVLIVCTELCTIHFQKNFSDDYILSTALFGDGSAAILISNKPSMSTHFPSIKINAFQSFIIHKGYNEMAWQLSETGFIMNLSSYISEIINGNLDTFFIENKIEVSLFKYWAIHPGGRQILDEFAKTMGLQKENLTESYSVLENFGNMSSATILFVLKQLLENNTQAKQNEKIFAAAFGPGLSIEGMELEYV
jgi:alpha-pyrone synthase